MGAGPKVYTPHPTDASMIQSLAYTCCLGLRGLGFRGLRFRFPVCEFLERSIRISMSGCTGSGSPSNPVFQALRDSAHNLGGLRKYHSPSMPGARE